MSEPHPLDHPFDAALIQRRKKGLRRELLASPPASVKRIAILGGSTTAELKDLLELFLLRRGIRPEFYESEYNKIVEDAVFSTPELDAFKPQLVLLYSSWVNLGGFPLPGDDVASVESQVEQEAGRWAELWAAVGAKHGCSIIQNNFDLPPLRLLGNLDAQDHRGRTRYVGRLNERLAQLASARNDVRLHDLNYVAATFGLDRWHDRQAWFSYKYACAVDAVPFVAYSLACQIAAMAGLSAKALISDLDNTFWGGVVGDDGVAGLQIGQETAIAEAHSAYQLYLRDLRDRGILLGIASKNDEANALEGLGHADNALKAADFSAIRANWDPKDGNLAAMAADLNLGVEAFVFVDDNPAERALVRSGLPAVRVPEVGAEPSAFPGLLDRGGYFESAGLSDDDLKRVAQYAQNAQRQKAQGSHQDYGAFLDSLGMSAEIGPWTPLYLDRITQLTNKTNQFNLTTRRCEMAEIEAWSKDPAWLTLYGRLKDKFGDHGLISVIAGRIEGSELRLELWLMSCRVLKRGMEHAMLDALVAAAAKLGVERLRGEYLPTAKNSMVKDLYAGFGFAQATDGAWVLPLAGYQAQNKHIQGQAS